MTHRISGIEAPSHVSRYSIYTARFYLDRDYDNPYDPAEIDVQAEFQLPSGRKLSIPAFWFQDYTVAPGSERYEQYIPSGSARWRVRFLPLEEGIHQLRIRSLDKFGNDGEAGPLTFDVRSSRARGPVGIHPLNPLHLQYANGAVYLPRGHNLGFEDGNPDLNGTAYYSRLLSAFAASGENWARFWMTDFSRTSLEWSKNHVSGFYSGLGFYSQRAAWRVDEFLRIAERNGVYVQLVLIDHGQFSNYANARWDSGNPYSSTEGGPVPQANPDLFFADSTACAFFQRRLRYTIARWAAFQNLLAWELWNEVQWAGTSSKNFINDEITRAAIVEWHRQMSGFLKAQDPFGHLVTTSSDDPGVGGFDAIWGLPSLDLVQSHHYFQPPSVRDVKIREFVTAAQQAYGKPVIVGEMGVTPGSEVECNFDPETFLSDTAIPLSERTPANRDHLRAGTMLRNGIWAASLCQSGGMNWWWGCYICDDARRKRGAPDFPLNSRLFPALTSFWGGEDPAAQSLQVAPIDTQGSILAHGLRGPAGIFLWVRDVREAYGSGFGPALAENRKTEGVVLTLTGLDAGDRVVSLLETCKNGDTLLEFLSTPVGGRLSLSLPPFLGDIALKIGGGDTRGWGLVPRAVRVWIAEGNAPITEAGYVCLQPVAGSGRLLAGAVLTLTSGGNATSDLTVPAVRPTRSLWTVAEIEAPSNVKLSLANAGSNPANVRLATFDAAGAASASGSLTLASGEHVARFLAEFFLDHPRPFRGTLLVTSDVPVGMLSLRETVSSQGEVVLTTLPAQPDEDADITDSAILPQMADGGGYQTEWLLVNSSERSMTGLLRFLRSDGSPWMLNVDGNTLSELEYTIQPYGLGRWITSGGGTDVEAGYCVLTSPVGKASPTASAVIRCLRHQFQSETGIPFVRSSQAGETYWETGTAVNTGVAFINLSERPQRIRLELFMRIEGESKLETTLELAAGWQIAKQLTDLFPQLPPTSRGFLRFSSDDKVAFIALRIRNTPRGDVLTSSLLLGKLSDEGVRIFPQVATGGGYSTQFILLNPGMITTEGRIFFRDSSPNPWRIILRGP
jgi:hypothetical protein